MKKFFTILLMVLLLATSAFARPHGGYFRPEPPRHYRSWSRPSYHNKSRGTELAAGIIGGYLLANSRPQPTVQYVQQPQYAPTVNYVQRQNSGVTCTTTVVNGVPTMQNCMNNPTINNSYIYYD